MKKVMIAAAIAMVATKSFGVEVYNNENKVKKGIELNCLLEDGSYHTKAYCHNEQHKIRFLTTFKKIKAMYNILHEQEVGTDHTNMYLVPNGGIAHKRIWIMKK
jgi:uncharacterized protein with FMN-binding domain